MQLYGNSDKAKHKPVYGVLRSSQRRPLGRFAITPPQRGIDALRFADGHEPTRPAAAQAHEPREAGVIFDVLDGLLLLLGLLLRARDRDGSGRRVAAAALLEGRALPVAGARREADERDRGDDDSRE